MRVAYDVTSCVVGDTGVARHTEQVGAALTNLGVDVRNYALGRGSRPAPPNTRWTRVPLRVLHQGWATVRLPRLEWLTPAADVVHTDLVVPPSRRPVVVTVYDLDALDRPDLHPARSVANQEAMLRSLARARAVIAISSTTAAALARRGVDETRVVVAASGFTPLPTPTETLSFGAERYVLHVGALHRRKAIDVLLKAWADSRIPADVVLVLAGPDDNAADELRKLAARLGVAERVRWEGRVDDQRLATLYKGAAVACFPSRAEGFGLPLLEAMAIGTPVVASDIAAFREVSGGAAVLVEPGEAGLLADALTEALSAAPDATRIQAGRDRAALFTWEACARQTIVAYERALA